MTAALVVGLLVAGGVFLLLRRGLLRIVLGFVLLGHAVNVLLVSAGGMQRRGAPLLGETEADVAADPLPQAFVLTAVVITFGITVYMLALARAGDPGATTGHPPARADASSPADGSDRDDPDRDDADRDDATADRGRRTDAPEGGTS
ncbi:sodium:proton antiporter [Modestobacter sp. VKM Ac-2984]|uniref:sodium:proton antiporter n=1 Tax=Modestobacter sp. VKM Ac-2984 TaxID=3004138 RepID=UPI0022AB43ED|nr:cation:proton antiporter subunit C [Modestobacter sp. VKM Ac-2984]MCZ2816484.1 cation:proton antiporter subunit C [Modestobacter sp. VKM Ac-2984]